MENRFNLVDEPWIPVAGHGLVSLKEIFSNTGLKALGGNPVQKIALLKLLLAIAQAANTPADEKEWQALGAKGLAEACLAYLDKWHDRFWLCGDKPFLQMPAVTVAKVQPFGALLPEISTGNTTVLTQGQMEQSFSDADKAMLVLQVCGFALSGKKTDNSVVLSQGYTGKQNDKGKPSSGRYGPSLGFMGLLHSFIHGESLLESIWLNVLTERQIAQMNLYPEGLGSAPWEVMPAGEDDAIARRLQGSLIGRLIPLCRFCLLADDGVHYSEGIAHGGYNEGVVDPSMAVDWTAKKPRALWADPDKRPWRELTALVQLGAEGKNAGFKCWQISLGLDRVRSVTPVFSIWSGGLRVSSNAGEQYASGSDDFVESQITLHSSDLGEDWYDRLKLEMSELDTLAKLLYGRVMGFFKRQLVDGKKVAEQATQLFWQLCERDFQALVYACADDEEAAQQRQVIRRKMAAHVHTAYNRFCPKDTARQLDAWADNQPRLGKYLKQEA